VKLWKVSERRKRTDGFNLRDEMGSPVDPMALTSLRVPVFKPMELMVEASPRRVFANAHTYHINSISVNSDGATYLSADDLRINLWHMENNDQSFSILAALSCGFIGSTTLKSQSNIYSNIVIGTLAVDGWAVTLCLVQRAGAWAGCGPTLSRPRCTKCNSPPINGQCTNFILFDVAL